MKLKFALFSLACMSLLFLTGFALDTSVDAGSSGESAWSPGVVAGDGIAFNGVAVSSPMQVILRQGPNDVHCDRMDLLDLEVVKGILRVEARADARKLKNIPVEISLPTLTKVSVTSDAIVSGATPFRDLEEVVLKMAGDGLISLELQAETVHPRMAGSGIMDLELDCTHVDGDIAGSGQVTMAGKAFSQRLVISGSGDFNAYDLTSEQAKISIAGSGECEVRVAQELKVRIMGSGSVRYQGDPLLKDQVMGSGRVVQVD